MRSLLRRLTGDSELLERAESERIRLESLVRDLMADNAQLRECLIETVRAALENKKAPLPQGGAALESLVAARVRVGSDAVRQAYKRFSEDVREFVGGGE